MSITAPSIERTGDTYRLVYQDVYSTTPDDLWQALTDPERLRRWMADFRGGFGIGREWEVYDGEGERWAVGTVTVCEAPRRLVTTWHAIEEEPTELEVTLAEVPGGTRLTLRHEGIQSIFYGAGWQTYLELIEPHLAAPDALLVDDAAWHARFTELHPGYAERFDHLR